MSGVLIAWEFIVPVSCFVESFSAVFEALAVCISVEALVNVNVNVLSAVVNALKFPTTIP